MPKKKDALGLLQSSGASVAEDQMKAPYYAHKAATLLLESANTFGLVRLSQNEILDALVILLGARNALL